MSFLPLIRFSGKFKVSLYLILWCRMFYAQIPMLPISGADGVFTTENIDNQKVFRSVAVTGGYSLYMYFATETAVINKTVYLEVKYLDMGTGRMGVDYNALGQPYKDATDSYLTYLTDSRLVKTAVFRLNNADFKNAQNLGADLRLYSDLAIQKHILSVLLYLEPSPLWKQYDENWNSAYSGRKHTGSDVVNANTLTGKIICGYQGWFRAPGDLSNQGWVHYFRDNNPANVTVDLWPDMTEYTDDEKYIVPGWKYKDNTKVFVFSSANKRTVLRHFQWMQAYGIHGAAVQRFVGGINPSGPNKEYNRIPAYAREAANRTGRVFYLEYDQSGVVGQDLVNRINTDWKYMVDSLKITSDSRYLKHNGKPVVGVYGLYPERFSSAIAHQVLDIFTQKGYEAFVMGSGEIFWHDASPPGWTPSWLSVYQRLGAYSPWNVGHYDRPDKLTANVATATWKKDKEVLDKAGVIFMPLIFPGFSWDNLMRQAPGTTNVPRRKGELMWNQIKTAKQLGVQSAFIAMFDEIDEGTSIFKVTNDVPVNNYFATLEGLPSDFYLSLTGNATSVLTGNLPLPSTMPDFTLFSQPSIPEIIKPVHMDTVGTIVKITWLPSKHSTGIKHYQLELDGKMIDKLTDLSFAQSLSNGSHTIKIRAINQINNSGGWSEENVFIVSDKVTAINGAPPFESTTITLFPNPVLNYLSIKTSNPELVTGMEILNMNGQIIRKSGSQKNKSPETITWTLDQDGGGKIIPGVYLLKVQKGGYSIYKKMIVL